MQYSFLIKFKIVDLNEEMIKIEKFKKYSLFKNCDTDKFIYSNVITKSKEFQLGKTYSLKVSCFDCESMKKLSNSLVKAAGLSEILDFQNHKITIVEIKLRDYSDIFKGIDVSENIKINFLSPTIFKFGDIYYNEPNPYLYLTKIYKRYKDELLISIPNFIFKKILVENSNYITKNIKIDGTNYETFLGSAEFSLSSPELKDYKSSIYELLKFSLFTGAGEFTEYGMGQVSIETI
ncbi:MAG: CRISPR system precrRNA processing endoribonuclease RAMP protein Cas6 [Fusobacteriaceae bacterium]